MFAAALLIMVGILLYLALAATINDQRFVVTGDYVGKFDITGWGWIHLILGLVAIGRGAAMIMGQTWSFIVALVIAILSAVAQFMWLPYYPIWAIVIIALDVAIIWALVRTDRHAQDCLNAFTRRRPSWTEDVLRAWA